MGMPTRRNSLRYAGYDYASPGGVFVTIVTHNRQELFGSIEVDDVILSPSGEALERRWNEIPQKFHGADIDAFMIMPDHIHGILWLGTADTNDPATSGDIVRWLKTSVLSDYSQGVKSHGWQPYAGKLWQRGFHDHIVRGERDLRSIREYIGANPAKWIENRRKP